MAIDPLSGTTRVERRNLLAVSTIAITAKTFNISLQTIPIAGLSIRFDPGVFSFLLVVTIIYFGVTFILYYIIDIKDSQIPAHISRTDESYNKKVDKFTSKTSAKVELEIDGALPENYSPVFDHQSYQKILREADLVWPRKLEPSEFLKGGHDAIIRVLHHLPGEKSGKWVLSSDAAYAGLAAIAQTNVWRYGLRVHLYRIFLRPWRYSIHSMYLFRLYGIDGVLPILAAVVSVAAIYNLIDLTWLSTLVPTMAVHTTP
ncbi:hypothetical protein FJV77_20725 [Mesorhizobium sp. WSM4306]|uniref:hypothetical protein n=1 Tax=Mesorhizobium sp. WSM4306 TaxID=2589885 RepID=UPI00115F4112|nr:hypothetical protein [Mesorhizobium sp. WSM4306]TRC93903.1 hypothetical protein FJV77_20725 [Mesorhizobium sp. WSM4306]